MIKTEDSIQSIDDIKNLSNSRDVLSRIEASLAFVKQEAQQKTEAMNI